MLQDLFAPLFREVHVEKNEVQAGCVLINICVVEKLRGQKSVRHSAGVGIDMGRFNSLAHEKDIAFIVLDSRIWRRHLS